MKRTKKVENKKCPYRDIIIEVGSGKAIYWCSLFYDERECIFQTHKHDAGECSHYLFPKSTREEYDKEKGYRWCKCGDRIYNEVDDLCCFCKEFEKEYGIKYGE